MGILRRLVRQAGQPTASVQPGPGSRAATIATAAPEEKPTTGLIAGVVNAITPSPTSEGEADPGLSRRLNRRAGPIRSLLGFGDQING